MSHFINLLDMSFSLLLLAGGESEDQCLLNYKTWRENQVRTQVCYGKSLSLCLLNMQKIDDYTKDGGPREVGQLCIFTMILCDANFFV